MNLQKYIDAAHDGRLNQAKLARAMGQSRQAVGRWLAKDPLRRTQPLYENAVLLAKCAKSLLRKNKMKKSHQTC